ncbi:hypothetical protein [Pseudovibrio ascidiaceicola]|uniref:hypothetical protein n=1 Tax=Pseudovibrio ascidiaceicola TaxID=285279 RepID=UPI000D690158|nr:hypothetical protein [Pseudovibrio ascidiaceicola]
MSNLFEFDLVFALGEGEYDVFELADAVYAVGFDDAVVGTGQAGLLAVALEVEGEQPDQVILEAARSILPHLPKGSTLREVRPDLVSLADVAKKLSVQRQALQKRKIPQPAVQGLYRVTELAKSLEQQAEKPTAGARRPRFSMDAAKPWFAAGAGAQTVNARIALGELDPQSLQSRKRSS